MIAVTSASEVFEAVQRAKAAAPQFCTNFVPVPATLDAWIGRGELFGATGDGAAFFLRKDRRFWHLYFCARDLTSLQRELPLLPAIRAERVVADLIFKDGSFDALVAAVEPAGLRPYTRMMRLARTGRPEGGVVTEDSRVAVAEAADCRNLLALIERFFDPLEGQFPTEDEMAAAVAGRQVLVARIDGALAGLLVFSTKGLTSTVRYWLVAEGLRDQGVGSALMRRYFVSQPGAGRFILWVAANNEDAIRKYGHYGFSPDGLVDLILVNAMMST